MGKDLYKNYPVAKEIFDRADNVLGYSIKDICFEDEQKLGETEFAQPAILTMSIAAMKVLEEEGVRADMTAGLSLGEYSAYVASEAMDFEEAVSYTHLDVYKRQGIRREQCILSVMRNSRWKRML